MKFIEPSMKFISCTKEPLNAIKSAGGVAFRDYYPDGEKRKPVLDKDFVSIVIKKIHVYIKTCKDRSTSCI